jgi:hypothetical protein
MNRTLKLLLVSLALCLLIFWIGGAWKKHPSQSDVHDFYGNDMPGEGLSDVSFGSSNMSKSEKERKDRLIEHAIYCREKALWAFKMNDLSSAQSWLNQAIADERAAR